jgi:hypothetical protein
LLLTLPPRSAIFFARARGPIIPGEDFVMAVINSELIQLSDEQRCQVASWLVDFDRSWNESRLAARVRELPAGTALRRAALIEMVKIDLEKQWQLGRRPTVESYLALYPEMGGAGNVPVDLIQAEYEVRLQFGEAADLAEIARRFPGQTEQLQQAVARSRQLVKDTELGDPAQPTRAPAASTLPEQFGRYRILQPLGQGGMGAVYLAEDTVLHRKVALKVPHFGPNATSQLHERFVREAKAAAAFDHPNLCPVYDVGCIDGVHYLTMRFIDGKALGTFIHPDKPLPVRTVLALVRKVALALAEAHQKGIVHRDLKPSNIMINARKEPVVMDALDRGGADHAKRGDCRHAGVHGPRAGQRPGRPDRTGLRCLQPGGDPVRDADGTPAL